MNIHAAYLITLPFCVLSNLLDSEFTPDPIPS
jgi:hypothetical protein